MTDLEAITTSTKILQSLGAGFYLDPKDLEALSHTIELASIFPKLKEIAEYPCSIQDYCSECPYHSDFGIYCASGLAQSTLENISKIEQILIEKENQQHDNN